MVWAIIAGGFAVILVVGGIFLLKGRKPTEVEEETELVLNTEGCSEKDRRRIREEYEQFLKEVILFRQKCLELVEKTPSLRTSEAYRNLSRIWDVAEDMKDEIEFYPSGDCLKHFREKFDFYRKLIRENFEKLNRGG
jgi:hypothetical protein